MKMNLKRKCSIAYAVKIEGKRLAPAIYVFDNTDEVAKILTDCFFSEESIYFDGTNGFVTFGWQNAEIGNYLVCDNHNFKKYETLDDIQEDYEVLR